MNSSEVSAPAVKSAEDFWTNIVERGGLMTAVRARGQRNYDADIETHVLKELGLSASHITLRLLKDNKVNLEQLVDAVFSAFEPWAALMTETFEMFAQANAQHGGDGIKIEIKLDELGTKLQTTLAAFALETRKTQKVMRSIRCRQWGEISVNNISSIYNLIRSFLSLSKAETMASSQVKAWGAHCRNRIISDTNDCPSPPKLSTTGDPQFDTLAIDAFALLQSFMKAARMIGPTFNARTKLVSRDDGKSGPILNDGWVISQVVGLDADFLMVALYEMLEHMALSRAFETAQGREIMDTLRRVIDALPVLDEVDQAEDLLSLLDLPSWKARHQLYAVWTASQIVKAAPWTPQWNLVDRTLNFDFGGAEIARFVADDSVFVLHSELRRNLDGISAGKRKKGIQPDFTLLHGSDKATSPGHLVVECKQYRTSNRRNFRAALSDYSNSHPAADVLLSNYGPVLKTVSEGLGSATRLVHGYGEARPLGSGLEAFVAALKSSFTRAQQIAACEKTVADARRRQELEEFFSPSSHVDLEKDASPKSDPASGLASISLCWDNGGDLDLHVFLQTGAGEYEVSFKDLGRAHEQPFAMLDRDSKSGPGRETVTLYAPLQGELRIEVRLYTGEWPSRPPAVIIKKASGWSTTLLMPNDKTSDLWEVTTFQADWLPTGSKPIDYTR